MNHQKIREELSKAEQAVEQLKKLLNEPQGVWRPAKDAKYWAVNPWAGAQEFHYSSGEQDEGCFAIGNCFPTKEAAELHVKRLKVIQKLRELAGGYQIPKSGYWYMVSYCKFAKKWETSCWASLILPFAVPFESEEKAQAAITTLGDELNVLLGDA